MARKQGSNELAVALALAQLKQMLDGAASELSLGREHSAGTLAIAGAVRASDLICDVKLGSHSVAASHTKAEDLLGGIAGYEHFVEDFSVCRVRKTEFNYHASGLTIEDAREVLDCASHLALEAVRLVVSAGWVPEYESEREYQFPTTHI